MFTSYFIGLVFCLWMGYHLYGAANVDPLEPQISARNYMLGVLLLAIFWPVVITLFLMLRLFWWVMDKWEDWERQK